MPNDFLENVPKGCCGPLSGEFEHKNKLENKINRQVVQTGALIKILLFSRG